MASGISSTEENLTTPPAKTVPNVHGNRSFAGVGASVGEGSWAAQSAEVGQHAVGLGPVECAAIESERLAYPLKRVPNRFISLLGGQVDEPHRQLGHEPFELELPLVDRSAVDLGLHAHKGSLDEHGHDADLLQRLTWIGVGLGVLELRRTPPEVPLHFGSVRPARAIASRRLYCTLGQLPWHACGAIQHAEGLVRLTRTIVASGSSGRPVNTNISRVVALTCAALLVPYGAVVRLQSAQQTPAPTAQAAAEKIPNDQLDSLVAPIALYPDPLLSQTLVASTYPLEIIQLQQWLEKNKSLKGKALTDAALKQPWDASIQAMVVLPDVVSRLANDIQWTTDLGNAFLAQQSDVMDAVQRMRKKAAGHRGSHVKRAAEGGNPGHREQVRGGHPASEYGSGLRAHV